MLGLVEILEGQAEMAATSAPRLRLILMPEITFLGELYETPQQRHPQERSLAELVGVAKMPEKRDNGVYAIRVDSSTTPQQVFLSEANKIVGKLPKREKPLPTYGRDEVEMVPHPIREKTELHKRVVEAYGKFSPETKFDFV